MSNCGTIQWVEDVRKKVNQTLKNRMPERSLVLRHLAKSHVSEPESHWHTLKLFLEDDEDFKNFLEDLIKEFQKNEEENETNIAMKNKVRVIGQLANQIFTMYFPDIIKFVTQKFAVPLATTRWCYMRLHSNYIG